MDELKTAFFVDPIRQNDKYFQKERKYFLIKSQLPPRPSKNYSKLVIWCCDDIFQKPDISFHLQICNQ